MKLSRRDGKKKSRPQIRPHREILQLLSKVLIFVCLEEETQDIPGGLFIQKSSFEVKKVLLPKVKTIN